MKMPKMANISGPRCVRNGHVRSNWIEMNSLWLWGFFGQEEEKESPSQKNFFLQTIKREQKNKKVEICFVPLLTHQNKEFRNHNRWVNAQSKFYIGLGKVLQWRLSPNLEKVLDIRYSIKRCFSGDFHLLFFTFSSNYWHIEHSPKIHEF